MCLIYFLFSGELQLWLWFVNHMLKRWEKFKMFHMRFPMFWSSIGWYPWKNCLEVGLWATILRVFFPHVSSTRKRQSVICRYPNGRLVLYCKVKLPHACNWWVLLTRFSCFRNLDSSKNVVCNSQGADTVIYERLADGNASIKKLTREHLEQFGSAGLRTLCLAYRDLTSEEYESWNERFIQAKSSLRDREKKLDEVLSQFLLVFLYPWFALPCLQLK